MTATRLLRSLLALVTLAPVACASESPAIPISSDATPTGDVRTSTVPAHPEQVAADVQVLVDTTTPGDEISPLILGVSGDLSPAQMRDIGITVDSWGGNPSSRYNYTTGHFWNAALDWEFRNTNYGQDGDSFRSFAVGNVEAGVATRLAVPTFGWIAKDATSCSFPDDDGGCLGGVSANRENPTVTADPRTTSVECTPETVAAWVADLIKEGIGPRFIAMDNEPELWGYTALRRPPECPTYEEILDTYLRYATAIRARRAGRRADGSGDVLLVRLLAQRTGPGGWLRTRTSSTWFLDARFAAHDEETDVRTLDVVDVHFYPQSGVYNDDVDAETNARRLRSMRSLYDSEYSDESWITEPIGFIPRMQRDHRGATPARRSRSRSGTSAPTDTMNGALAIADVLGVYGREGVYAGRVLAQPAAGQSRLLRLQDARQLRRSRISLRG